MRMMKLRMLSITSEIQSNSRGFVLAINQNTNVDSDHMNLKKKTTKKSKILEGLTRAPIAMQWQPGGRLCRYLWCVIICQFEKVFGS